MKGDFTRDTFDPANHFSRVLMQQGRVTLDADHNEQTAILLHYLRTLARDLIGPYAAPVENGGFAITSSDTGGFKISPGRYYVDGVLIENEEECTYATQPDYPLMEHDPILAELQDATGKTLWLYLDVWERHITSIEDDGIREKALGGPDTCTRAEVVWQVKALPIDLQTAEDPRIKDLQAKRAQIVERMKQVTDPGTLKEYQQQLSAIDAEIARLGAGAPNITCDTPLGNLDVYHELMAARLDPGAAQENACVIQPDAKYRGAENQLYRVEIHQGGAAGTATFKWSRDNGSVVAAWLGTSGNDLQVSTTRGFEAGCWVELTDDVLDLQGRSGPLVRLTKVEGGTLTVDPASLNDPADTAWSDSLSNPKARRWDQAENGEIVLSAGAVPLVETSATKPVWIDLEDGIQVQFSAGGNYRSGDYWQIPARVATGQIEWPSTIPAGGGDPVADALPPDGIEHHYAPLGFVMWSGKNMRFKGCRCEFEPLSSCFRMGSAAVGASLVKPGSTVIKKAATNAAVKEAAKSRRRKTR